MGDDQIAAALPQAMGKISVLRAENARLTRENESLRARLALADRVLRNVADLRRAAMKGCFTAAFWVTLDEAIAAYRAASPATDAGADEERGEDRSG